jgi:fibronectin type 3 domain-containing protein
LAGFAVLALAAMFALAGCPTESGGTTGDLSTPTGLNATASGTSVELSWNSVNGATIYRVYRGNSESGSYTPLNESVSGTSYIDSGLSAGTYYYKVSAASSAGDSPQSSAVSATVGGGGLSAPTGLNAAASGTSVELSWNSVNGAEVYKVYRGNSESGSYTQINVASGTSYTDSGLSAGTYYYKVSAVSSSGEESPQSSADSATVGGGGGGLSAPANLTAAASGTSVELSWNSVNGAEVYKVYRGNSESGSYTQINVASGTSYTDSGLSAGTYYYKVSAVSASGTESPQSSADSATVGGGGGGDTLAGAKGKLTLTGFNEFDGKYVYSALVTSSGSALIGTNGVEYNAGDFSISMVQISGGTAEVPLYTTTYTGGTSVADIYVPYEGSETFQAVAVMILNDADGKFSSGDAASFATNYAAMISSNASNTSFAPSTTNGSITIGRGDVMTMDEMTAAMSDGDYTVMQTIKYMLIVNP